MLILFLIVNITFLFSQVNKSTKTESFNGKSFYIHIVEKGQTLYAISKIYNVSVDEILEYNSEANTGIKKGQILKIISKEEKKNQNVVSNNDSTKFQHIIKSGESLYSISTIYNVTVDEIKLLNPKLKNELSLGQSIWIPIIKRTQKEVKNSEVAEKISEGVKPIINIKKTESEEKLEIENIKTPKINKEFNGYYNIALFIPFYLKEIDNTSPQKFDISKDIETYKSFSFIQFYESFLLALKKFENQKIKINVKVFDVTDDTIKLNKLLKSKSLSDIDLIIGPFYNKSFKVASRWSIAKQVYIINPFSSRLDITKNNHYSIRLSATIKDEIASISNYCYKNYPNANILIIHNNSEIEKVNLQLFKEKLTTLYSQNKNFKFVIKEIIYNEKGINGVNEKLVSNEENILIPLFHNEATVTNFVRRLYELKKDNITLFGNSNWHDYNNIETSYFQYLKLHYYDNYFVDYENEDVIKFIENYRTEYLTEPSINKFAFQGYDICTYFIGAMIKYGYNWFDKIDNYNPTLLSSKYNLYRKENSSGIENSAIQIYKLEDYKFVKVN